ncbi:MAG: bifunctional phosphopantothenoylcysteine decarboxylase/phosphopantothenate--cysteine ligase CoaBC [Acidiferrobacterales bacterium]
MVSLTNKHILLGVTGGIAAYKSAEAVRRLRDAGAEVRVVMTRAATEFITPLTMQAVSGHPAHLHLLDAHAESGMGHIELARWADAVLVAPASANFIAKLAHGLADDLLSALCLANDAPLAVAPAMNRQMWDNPATQSNLATLQKNGVRIFGPGSGAQACGESGAGRMLEPVELVSLVSAIFETGELAGLNVLVTAGPTWEPIDPVRVITNRSSGKMGYAIAAAAMEAGARVTLISGPTALPPPERVECIHVMTAQEMFDAVQERVAAAQVFIGAAAVADYRPAQAAAGKIKKTADTLQLDLVRNPDILASVASRIPAPFIVGFAAETGDLERNAAAKLRTKRADLIAANLVGQPGSGFEADDNRLLLVDASGTVELPLLSKARTARELIHHIAVRYHAKNPAENSRLAHWQ